MIERWWLPIFLILLQIITFKWKCTFSPTGFLGEGPGGTSGKVFNLDPKVSTTTQTVWTLCILVEIALGYNNLTYTCTHSLKKKISYISKFCIVKWWVLQTYSIL